MTTRSETAAEIRSDAYRLGMALRKTANNKRDAAMHAASLSEHYPEDRHGIRFMGMLIPGTKDWGVYGVAVPLLDKGEPLEGDKVTELIRRAREWPLVLVREFKTSGSARTTAHRDNSEASERFPEIGEAGIRFRAQAIGYGGKNAPVHGEYAYIPQESKASAALQEDARG